LRKTPHRHSVKSHIRSGGHVTNYERGKGKAPRTLTVHRSKSYSPVPPGPLTTEERKRLTPYKKHYAIPEKAPGPGSYPVHDRRHAVNALGKVKRFGTRTEIRRVRREVHERHPDLPSDWGKLKRENPNNPGMGKISSMRKGLDKAHEKTLGVKKKLVYAKEALKREKQRWSDARKKVRVEKEEKRKEKLERDEAKVRAETIRLERELKQLRAEEKLARMQERKKKLEWEKFKRSKTGKALIGIGGAIGRELGLTKKKRKKRKAKKKSKRGKK